MWSVIYSLMYKLKKSCGVVFLGSGTSIFLTSELYIYWSEWIFWISFILLPESNYWLIVSWSDLSLNAWEWFRAYSTFWSSAGACLAPAQCCSSFPLPFGVCLISSALCSFYSWPTETSLRPISSSDILLLVLLSFIAGGSPFNITVEPLCGCNKSKVCNTCDEDPHVWWRSTSGSQC